MDTIDRHIEKCRAKEVVGSNEQYLPLQEATRIVEECSCQSTAVIGIDFVHVRAGKIYPHVPINSADWSVFLEAPCWEDVVAQCNRASLRVLEQEEREEPGQFCSFVFFSKEEWAADFRPQTGQ